MERRVVDGPNAQTLFGRINNLKNRQTSKIDGGAQLLKSYNEKLVVQGLSIPSVDGL
jgi:hypothetical protein